MHEDLVDDFVRAADSDARTSNSVFQRAGRRQDWMVLVVGAELAPRILGSRARVDHSQRSNDRLVARAVPVVLEAIPIVADVTREVLIGHEQVVDEESIPVEGSLLCDLRCTDTSMPDEWRRSV